MSFIVDSWRLDLSRYELRSTCVCGHQRVATTRPHASVPHSWWLAAVVVVVAGACLEGLSVIDDRHIPMVFVYYRRLFGPHLSAT